MDTLETELKKEKFAKTQARRAVALRRRQAFEAYQLELKQYKKQQALQQREENRRAAEFRKMMLKKAVAQNVQRKNVVRAHQAVFALRKKRQRDFDQAKIDQLKKERLIRERQKQLEATELIRHMQEEEQMLLKELALLRRKEEEAVNEVEKVDEAARNSPRRHAAADRKKVMPARQLVSSGAPKI